jgi:hypothetical protein
MATSDDLEAYLNRLDRRFEKVGDSTFLVALGLGQPPAAVRVSPPVVLIQVEIGPAPAANSPAEAKLFRRLLEFNARDLLHAAYGIDQGRILLDAALDLASLDLREIEAALANIDLAIATHVPELRALSK